MFKKTNSIVRGLTVVLLLTFLLTGMSLTAFAAENEATATIRVHQVFSVNSSRWQPENQFTYVLRTEEAGTPMPKDAVNGEFLFTMQGTSYADIGAITYNRAGQYVYTVRQRISSAQTGYTYDDEVYTVVVTVRNQLGGGLSATVELPVNHEGFKENEIRFENSYYKAVPSDSNSPKTGDNSNLTLWIAMMAASLACLLLLFWKRRKDSKEVQS